MITSHFSTIFFLVTAAAIIAPSQGCPYIRSLQKMGSNGNGNGNGGGGGHGGGGHGSMAHIQELLDNHAKIDREVMHNDDGSITAKTFSDDAQVAGWLQAHVAEMRARVEENMHVRSWDPLYVSLVDHHDETSVELTHLSNGVQVELSASTDCGQSLIEAHAAVVSLFVETGREEASKAHDVPATCNGAATVSISLAASVIPSDGSIDSTETSSTTSHGLFATTLLSSLMVFTLMITG